jgi:3-hydroxyisobutyrate dehydrogenase
MFLIEEDVDLVIREAKKLNLNIDTIQGARQIIETSLKTGLENEDYSFIYNAVNPTE